MNAQYTTLGLKLNGIQPSLILLFTPSVWPAGAHQASDTRVLFGLICHPCVHLMDNREVHSETLLMLENSKINNLHLKCLVHIFTLMTVCWQCGRLVRVRTGPEAASACCSSQRWQWGNFWELINASFSWLNLLTFPLPFVFSSMVCHRTLLKMMQLSQPLFVSFVSFLHFIALRVQLKF